VSEPNETDKWSCDGCGDCCHNNGAIPPALDMGEDDIDLPEWMHVLVRRLREFWASSSEEQPHCVFLTDDLRCAVHDVAKPACCKEFRCDR